MRTQIVNFRADDALAAAMAELARKDGVTISDVIRDALRDRVARDIAPEPVQGPLNPFAHLRAAATGDIVAQRALAEEAMRLVVSGSESDPLITVSEGLVFARLAAEHGDISDHGRVIGMLGMADSICGLDAASEFYSEALARIAILADQGVDMADLLLTSCAEDATPKIMALAQQYRQWMLETVE